MRGWVRIGNRMAVGIFSSGRHKSEAPAWFFRALVTMQLAWNLWATDISTPSQRGLLLTLNIFIALMMHETCRIRLPAISLKEFMALPRSLT